MRGRPAATGQRPEPSAGGYRERPGAPGGPLVCEWRREPTRGRAEPRLVLPDGCVDVIWSGGRLLFAGPDTVPMPVADTDAQPIVGVRMRMWTVAPLLAVPLREIANRRIAIEDAFGRTGAAWRARLERRSPAELPAILRSLVNAMIEAGPPPDRAAAWAGAAILARHGDVRIDRLAAELGYSERHLHRRFVRACGYSPKTYARVVRFQRALALLAGGRRTGEEVARRCGFADASHLVREVRALGGGAPTALLSELSNPAQLSSSA